MSRRLAETHQEPLVRTCERCGFTLPSAYFDESCGTCTECRGRTPLNERVACAAADYTLRCHAALNLLNLGLAVAAAEVLAGRSWPSLQQARRMQRRNAA